MWKDMQFVSYGKPSQLHSHTPIYSNDFIFYFVPVHTGCCTVPTSKYRILLCNLKHVTVESHKNNLYFYTVC